MSQPTHRHQTRAATAARALTRAAAFTAAEELEPRRLFAAVVVGPIPTTNGSPGGDATTINLSQFFNDDTMEMVRFTTPLGNYRLRLNEAQKPITVANFMKYVNEGRYNGTVVHRSAALLIPTPDIIQGGGYTVPGYARIATDPPIVNEFTTNGEVNNTRGTIAMAKTSNPNSATSEWFVNVQDTTEALNNPANSGGFTVFGNVLESDLSVIDAIAALPRFDVSNAVETVSRSTAGAFGEMPLRNYTQADADANKVPTPDNVLTVTAAELPDLAYTATSSDPTLVTPTIDGDGNLVLNYGSAARGSSTITVTATPIGGGASVSSTFQAGVGQAIVQLGGDSGNRSLSFREDDGTAVTVSVKGPGTATVRLSGNDVVPTAARGRVTAAGTGIGLDLITVTGTTAASTVTIGGRGGSDRAVALNAMSVDGTTRAISAKAVALTGSVTTTGPVGALTLGNTTGATITLGGTAADGGSALSFGTMTDTDLISQSPVRSLKIAGTANTDAEADVIAVTGGIDSISVGGDMASDVTASGEGNIRSMKVSGELTGDVTAHQIGSLSVRRGVTGATVAATHEANEHASAAEANQKANLGIGSVKVSGAVTDAVIRSAGSIGSISAASLSGTRVFAVAENASIAVLPALAADFSQEATINSMKVKAFTNTLVAAKYLGKLSVGTIANAADGVQLGFSTTRITSLAGTLATGGRVAVKNAETSEQVAAALDGLTLSDFVVRVL